MMLMEDNTGMTDRKEIYGKIEDILPEGFGDVRLDSPEFRDALTDILFGTSPLVAVTGPGGCGKTVLLKIAAAYFGDRCLCIAPTGIAAQNISGKAGEATVVARTIHSALGLDVLPADSPDYPAERNPRSIEALDGKDVVLLDEVSMVRANMLDHVMFQIMMASRMQGHQIRLVCFGDPMQLPPVEKGDAEPLFFFDSEWWRHLNPRVHSLKAVYRQDNASFKLMLNDLREGEMTDRCMTFLISRTVSSAPAGALILNPYNRDIRRDGRLLKGAATANREAVEKFKADHPDAGRKVFRPVIESLGDLDKEAEDTGRNAEVMALEVTEAPAGFEVIVGERVMCTRNSPEGNYVNGALGTVTGFAEYKEGCGEDAVTVTGVMVRLDNPNRNGKRDVLVKRHIYDRPATSDRKAVVVKQVPLTPAYEISYHKSQGMTLDNVCIRPHAWGPGMLYVGLSRVRTPEGLTVLGKPDRSYLKTSGRCLAFCREHGRG